MAFGTKVTADSGIGYISPYWYASRHSRISGFLHFKELYPDIDLEAHGFLSDPLCWSVHLTKAWKNEVKRRLAGTPQED